MGQGSSRNYPQDSSLSEGTYTLNIPEAPPPSGGSVGSSVSDGNDMTLALRKDQINGLYNKMRSNLKMYMLYDNFDSKNKVILSDLKKKTKNQEEELKNILESRDKLKVEFQTKHDDTKELTSKDKTTENINTLLFLILLGTIIFIIYKIYTYPMDQNNTTNNGVNLNKLLDLETADLNNLSEADLNNLAKAFDTKINLLENNINNINKSNKNSNKSTNSIKNSTSNSVNNITNSNIKKRNKLTLN